MRNVPSSADCEATITELVGAPGAGKTTLMMTLQRERGISALAVPPTKSVQALLRGIACAIVLSVLHRVAPSASLRLARNCVAVKHAYLFVRHLQGSWLVDEGPLRLLRERPSGSGRELVAWKQFATKIIQRISTDRQNVRMVVLEVPRELHERRYRERSVRDSKHRRRVGGLRNRVGLFLDRALQPVGEPITLGCFVDETLSVKGAGSIQIFRCGADETPDQIARRFSQEVLSGEAPKRYPLSKTQTC